MLLLRGHTEPHSTSQTRLRHSLDDLFAIPGAGQDAVLYDFATDIDNTQRAEIEIMRGMLKENK